MSDKRDTPPPTERTIIRPARAPGAVPGLSPAPGASPFPPPPGGPAAGPVPGGAERTVIAPASGGSPASPFGAPPPAYTPPSGSAGSATPMGSPSPSGPVRIEFAADEPPSFGPEPLVAAAGRLIHLASRLKTMAVQPDLGPLRQLVIRELDAFSKRAQGMGLEPRSIQLAHYILCAFIDDAVMSTPWGANSPWSQHSLLAAYHNDVQGGERLFQFAERMESDPNREPRLMELLYLCLSLGFEGRAALVSGGQNLLGQHRTRLAAAIAQQRGSAPDELSPQWRGATVAGGRYQPRVPLWVICTGLALIGLLVFAALLFRLSSESSAAITALDQAVGTTAPPPAPPPAPETQTPTYDRIRSILAPDVDAGRLAVLREGDDIVIRLVNQGLFDSGSATPAGSWNATFGRLAEAANLTHGQIRIEGHTDNQQIRSLAFPSNLQLSQARASAVGRALLSAGLADGNRLRTDGYGDAQPIGDNSTADGRRENRRVEIRVANDIAWR